MYLQSFHLIHSWPAGRKSLESLSPLPVVFHLSRWGFKGHCLQVYPCLFCGSVCQQDLGCCIRREIADFSSSVLDQRPTISKGCQAFPMFAQCLSLLRHRKRWHGPQGPSPSPPLPPSLPSWSPVITHSGSRTFQFTVKSVLFSGEITNVFTLHSVEECVLRLDTGGVFTARQPVIKQKILW